MVAEAQAREAEGVQEIVITGTQLGAYGRDLTPPRTRMRCLARCWPATSSARISMSSLQPQDLDGRADRAVGRPAHVPSLPPRAAVGVSEACSSACGGATRRSSIETPFERLRRAVPDVAITTDVIVGFPGETDAEFEECLAFCHEMAFAGIHVFPYSQREHTLAARMPDAVSDAVKKERVHRLIELAETMADAYRRRFIGRTMPVLWETQRDGVWEGLTDTYVRVHAVSDADLTNRTTGGAAYRDRSGGASSGEVVTQ